MTCLNPCRPATPLPPHFFALFPLAFAALWIGVCFLLSHLGGWQALARRYAATTRPDGRKFNFVSAGFLRAVTPVNYGHSLQITVGAKGIWIRPVFLFRLFHPMLFLPWTALTMVEPVKFLFFNTTLITFKDYSGRIQIWGAAGREILARWPDGQRAD